MIALFTSLALITQAESAPSAPMPDANRIIPPETARTNDRSPTQQKIDVQHYELSISVDPARKYIQGQNIIRFKAVDQVDALAFDLDSQLRVSGVIIEGAAAEFRHEKGTISITPPRLLPRGQQMSVTINYAGHPHIAQRAPWDGGFVWSTTPSGQPWIATAVQGDGCDLFWPCIDDVADKPDTMDMRITVPSGLSVASNGVLKEIYDNGGSSTFHWQVRNPISAYNISLNIAPYERLQQNYTSINGSTVPLEFWALPENRQKAEALIRDDLIPMTHFFEQLLGPYPWATEKLGIVDTPHLGMEHQTINAYGNEYRKDTYGYDWLLQHELSHEWFGNLLTHKRNADFWLHEGFARYMQAVYAGHTVGAAGYWHYMWRDYGAINNCNPPVPDQPPHQMPAGQMPGRHDVYYKGAWFLHTLRHAIGDEAFWSSVRALLYGNPNPWSLQAPFKPRYHSTDQFMAIVNSRTKGRDMTPLFNAILRQAKPPVVKLVGGAYRYVSADGTVLNIPVETKQVGKTVTIDPESKLYRALRPAKVCGR